MNTGPVDLHLDPVEPSVAGAVRRPEPEQIVRAVLAEDLRDEVSRRVRVRDGAAACVFRERTEIGERLRSGLEAVWVKLIDVDVSLLEGRTSGLVRRLPTGAPRCRWTVVLD